MSRLRLFVTWLILAALPLQGWAAASMGLCAPAVDRSEAMQSQHPQHAHHAVHAADAAHAAHAAHAALTPEFADVPSGLLDLTADHQCDICAMCGHAMALATPLTITQDRSAPQVRILAPSHRIDSRAHPVPDKPPRA